MIKSKLSVVIVLLLVFSLLIACSSGDSDDIESTVQLDVEVEDARTEEAIAGTAVKLESVGGETHTQDTNEEGRARFVLRSGDYQLEATKDEYLVAETEISFTGDYVKELALAPEVVTETIEGEASIGNGLYDMEISGAAADLLKGKEMTVSKAELEEGALGDLEAVGPAISFAIGDASATSAQINTAADNPTVNMSADISNLREDDYDLAVLLIAGEESEISQVYNTQQLDGKIKGDVPLKNSEGNLVNEIILSVVEAYEKEDEVTIEDAKDFVNNLKDHGVNLQELGQDEIKNIEASFVEDVTPYMLGFGYRMTKLGDTFRVWDTLEVSEFGPGDYTVNLDSLDEFRDMRWAYPGDYIPDYDDHWDEYRDNYEEQYNRYENYYFAEVNEEYDSYLDYINQVTNFVIEADPITDYDDALTVEGLTELEHWVWNIEFADYDEKVMFKITNPQDIVDEELIEDDDYEQYYNVEIDLSDANFVYKYTSDNSANLDWSLEFTLDVESTQLVEGTYIWEDIWYEWDADKEENVEFSEKRREDYKIIAPDQGSINLIGKMTDDLLLVDGDNEELPDIGEVNLDASLTFDLREEPDNILAYDGVFESEELNIDAGVKVEFDELPTYQDLYDDMEEGKEVSLSVLEIEINGGLETNRFKANGLTEISFIDNNEPDLIKFGGYYENLVDHEGFIFDGSLTIDFDSEDFNPDLEESEDNYLGGSISLLGELKNTGFEDVKLDITAERTGFEDLISDFEYHFDGNRYIKGNASLDDRKFELDADNEQELWITLAVKSEHSQEKVGEIGYGDQVYGDILVTDDLQVNFDDGTIISLIP